MKSSKTLGIILTSALVASVAATAAVSVSAGGITNISQIKDHQVGIVGSFNGWKDDVAMTDSDGDGIYEAVLDVVAKDGEGGNMVDAQADTGDGTGKKESRGFKAITFKVRLDGSWDDSWGDYEASYVRTYNSQTDCAAKVEDGQHVKITVKLNTTKNHPDAVAAGEAGDAPEYELIPVEYSVEVVKEESSEPSSQAPESSVESTTSTVESSVASTASTVTSTTTSTVSSTAPATESKTDGTTVPTGDTTSAAALVAVVLASLGTAVVMTKKASAKD